MPSITRIAWMNNADFGSIPIRLTDSTALTILLWLWTAALGWYTINFETRSGDTPSRKRNSIFGLREKSCCVVRSHPKRLIAVWSSSKVRMYVRSKPKTGSRWVFKLRLRTLGFCTTTSWRSEPRKPFSMKKSILGFRVVCGRQWSSMGLREIIEANWVLSNPWDFRKLRTESGFLVAVSRIWTFFATEMADSNGTPHAFMRYWTVKGSPGEVFEVLKRRLVKSRIELKDRNLAIGRGRRVVDDNERRRELVGPLWEVCNFSVDQEQRDGEGTENYILDPYITYLNHFAPYMCYK